MQNNTRAMRIRTFEWDEGNVLHLALGHGIEPEEAEEVFAVAPVLRKTKQGHVAALGPTRGGRLLVVVFERKSRGAVRIITGWDMTIAQKRWWKRNRGR